MVTLPVEKKSVFLRLVRRCLGRARHLETGVGDCRNNFFLVDFERVDCNDGMPAFVTNLFDLFHTFQRSQGFVDLCGATFTCHARDIQRDLLPFEFESGLFNSSD